jgi:hypothetical protein
MSDDTVSIFISYASPDRDRVLPFFEWLKGQGFNVWMDYRSMKAGQNWDHEIHRALEKSTFVLSFISNGSSTRRGYIQKELRIALEKKKEKLDDDLYIIPVLLDDDVRIPDQIKDLHCIKASDQNCYQQITDSIHHQLDRLGIERREIQDKEQVYWTSELKREEWDGIPGYEVELQFINFRSDTYPNVSEISDHIKGDLLRALFERRAQKFSPMPEVFNYGQDRFSRTNTYDAHCSDPVIQGRVLSLTYAIHWYGSRAAHPNHHFKSYVFSLEPIVKIPSLKRVFEDPDNALKEIQRCVREELSKPRYDESEEEEWTLEAEWIEEGTSRWRDFRAFSFQKEGVEVLFPPYQVGAYVLGSHSVLIPYKTLLPLMKETYISALSMEHLALRS